MQHARKGGDTDDSDAVRVAAFLLIQTDPGQDEIVPRAALCRSE